MGGELGERALLLRRLPAQGTRHPPHAMSRLFLILGDQLHPDPHPLLVDFDPRHDRLLMIEASEESTHVWSHKARSALFLARHRARFASNPRMAMPLKNLDRLGETELAAIRHRAKSLRADLDAL